MPFAHRDHYENSRATDAFELLSSCSHRYTHGNLTKSEAFEGSEHEDKQARVEKLSRAAIAIALLARKVASLIQVCRVLCEMLCRGSAESTSSGRISVQFLLFSERKRTSALYQLYFSLTSLLLSRPRNHFLLQAQKLEPPMQYMEDLEGQALRECLPTISGTSLLGKALVLLAGVHSLVQEDSSLVVTTLEGSSQVSVLPMVPGDIVFEVASRSCSWYKGMTLEDILAHLQVRQYPALSFVLALRLNFCEFQHADSLHLVWQSKQLVVGLKSEGMPPWAKPSQVKVTIRQPGFVV